MTRTYYNAIYSRTGYLRDVIAYESAADATAAEARAARDDDARLYDGTRDIRVVPIKARDAMRLARELFGLRTGKRCFGHICFCGSSNFGSGYAHQFRPVVLTHY